jgi:metal-sulfur cluster biosynthetic enzyme
MAKSAAGFIWQRKILMTQSSIVREQIITALKDVIDPETGADVVRMRLVVDLHVHQDGTAEYVFRPSSPLCPIALTLVMSIIEAVKAVDGVTDQKVTVVDYVGAEDLNMILESLPLSKSPKPVNNNT